MIWYMQASVTWKKPNNKLEYSGQLRDNRSCFFDGSHGIGLYTFFPRHIQYDVHKYNTHSKGE